jgi:hypothetical protein
VHYLRKETVLDNLHVGDKLVVTVHHASIATAIVLDMH